MTAHMAAMAESLPFGDSFTDVVNYTVTDGTTSVQTTLTVTVNGVDNDDVFQGTVGADRIDAGIGNDTIFGLAGDDVLLGDPSDDLIPQLVVPAGTWMGAAPKGDRGWSMFGCTVTPGFLAEDYEGGVREELAELTRRLDASGLFD